MNRYTIEYYYADYSGVREIFAEDEETAITQMWSQLRQFMTLPTAYQSQKIIDVEYNINGND